MKFSMAAMRSLTEVKLPRRMAWRVMIEKKISTGRCSTRSCIWGLRQVVCQQGCDDAGGQRGDRGWHVAGQDRGDHRRAARRALPVAAGEAGLSTQEEWEEKTARPACLVGQAGRRSRAAAAGGVLRASVFRPLPWFPSRPWLPHRAERGGGDMEGNALVHRGRHLRLLRLA
jgi:hypothetical protein